MEPKQPEGPAKRNPREKADKQLENITVGSKIFFEETIYKVIAIDKKTNEYVLDPSDRNKKTETVHATTIKEELKSGKAVLVDVGESAGKWTPEDQQRLSQLEAEASLAESAKIPEKIRTFSPEYVKEIVRNFLVSQKSTIKINSLEITANDDTIKLSGKIQAKDDYRARKGDYNTAYVWSMDAELFNDGDTLAIRGSGNIAAKQDMMKKIKEHIEKESDREIENMKIENGQLKVTLK